MVALFIPVAIIYIAFSRLARSNARLEEALKKLEALQGQILSTSKLASVGAISLDLAHQIKNPLAILLGRLEGLQDQLEEGSRARSRLDIALEAGWRIHQLTDSFTSIGQQQKLKLDVLELLSEALGTAGTRNPKRVETRWECDSGLPQVEGNPVLLKEALSNILANAIEAVAEGGRIAIAVSQVGGAIVTRISDNGPGIPQEHLAHLFEPFYTTKPGGQGLGLFAAKHILEMHGGSVDMETKEGEGTEVKVTLPAFLPKEQDETEGLEDSNGTQPLGRS
jgi:signal transduction histidine kinase